jgi:ribosomal protein L11 methyltransferase
VPYRIDIRHASSDALDRLIELGMLDAEPTPGGGLAALMPDSVVAEDIARALGLETVSVSPATGRDAGSVWVLSPRPIQVGRLRIAPVSDEVDPDTLRLIDDGAFGTGMHPTTALCLEALQEELELARPSAVLDVGTGSGVLALAALLLGVPQALGIDIDDEALRVASENARLNGLDARLQLSRGGPETVSGAWPLVFANVLAAPLIEMAPPLVQRIAHHGRLVLSGIPSGVEPDVDRAYRQLGMLRAGARAHAGWVALTFQASW